VEVLEHVDEQGLLFLYHQTDLLLMPIHDCTANNDFLESMACGVPVMTNRVGGVDEYLDPEHCIIMEGKDFKDWYDKILELSRNRDQVAGLSDADTRVRALKRRVAREIVGYSICVVVEVFCGDLIQRPNLISKLVRDQKCVGHVDAPLKQTRSDHSSLEPITTMATNHGWPPLLSIRLLRHECHRNREGVVVQPTSPDLVTNL